jgi:hypothetical protein
MVEVVVVVVVVLVVVVIMFHDDDALVWTGMGLLPNSLGVYDLLQICVEKPCIELSSPPHVLHARPSHSSRFDDPNNVG